MSVKSSCMTSTYTTVGSNTQACYNGNSPDLVVLCLLEFNSLAKSVQCTQLILLYFGFFLHHDPFTFINLFSGTVETITLVCMK